ncbi:hypothetical protein KPATCC21470_3769 [Kitasatospora purpeofusca]
MGMTVELTVARRKRGNRVADRRAERRAGVRVVRRPRPSCAKERRVHRDAADR